MLLTSLPITDQPYAFSRPIHSGVVANHTIVNTSVVHFIGSSERTPKKYSRQGIKVAANANRETVLEIEFILSLRG